MIQSRKDEARKYRAKKKESMGAQAYKEDQSRKRRERRAKKSIEKKPMISMKSKILTSNPKSKGLLEVVYDAKVKYDSNLNNPKGVKKTTVAAQLNKVINIYKKMTGQTPSHLNWLKKTNVVINFINNHSAWKTANSKNSQLQAIASIIKALKGFNDAYKIYSDLSTNGRKAINEIGDENKTTEKERVNILPWGEIKNLYKLSSVSDKALMAFYTLLPPRRVEDVSLITLTNRSLNFKEHELQDFDDEFNYLFVDKNNNPKKIIYIKYKTFKFYGRVEINIPPALAKILKTHITTLNLQEGDALFGTKKGSFYKNFSEVVSKVFKKYSGKLLTANLLRHAYISNYLKTPKSIAQKKQTAIMMGHSVSTQNKYLRLDI
jgi:hypothetical protein